MRGSAARGWLARSSARTVALLLLVGVAGDPRLSTAAGEDPADPVEVRLEEGRLSVAIKAEAARVDVIGEIGRAAGVELYVHGELGAIAPRRFKDLPLDEGIRRLVGRHGLVLDYRGGRSRRAEPREPVLRGIRVYGHGDASEPARLVVEREAPASPAAPTTPADQATSRAVAQRRVVELSYRRDAAALEELRRLLGSEEDARARRDAANALASVGGPEALDALGRVGLADRDPQVRVQAAQGLWRARGTAARATITQALAREQDPSTREALEGMLAGHPLDFARDQASRFRTPR